MSSKPPEFAETLPLDEDAFGRTTPLDEAHIHRFRREDADGLVGRRLDHFEVLGTLGGGGMGTVYRARDVALERIVALKVLPEDLNEPALIARFKREARAQARLSHPNVVPIYFIGEQDTRHYFAMELVEGASLDAVLEERGALGWATALEYMLDVSRALRQAHQRGLIHRDLKPGNLLLTPEGHIKVADFGLAKPIVDEDQALTQEGAFLGTPMYIAPEQARGVDVDHRADMYAMGATFFHLLSGQPVFSAPTPMAVIVKHVSEPAPSIDSLGVEVPRAMIKILSRLLAKAPEDRFADYDALITALEAARPRVHPEAGLLVRSTGYALDVALIGLSALAWAPAPLILYPLYFIGAWTWRGRTLGQQLFQIETLRADNHSLALKDALKRFGAMHWGLGAFTAILLLMKYGLGIESINIKNMAIMSAGNQAMQLLILVVIIAIFIIWLGGVLMAAVHPRKRSAHDLLSHTKVTYRIEKNR